MNNSSSYRSKPLFSLNKNFLIGWGLIFLSNLLILIWPVIGTIALRHLCIAGLFFLGLIYLFKEQSFHDLLQVPRINLLPLGFIFLFIVWVIAHYLMFTFNPEMELKQLSSIWLRVVLEIVGGFATGVYFYKNLHLKNWLLPCFVLPGLYVFYKYFTVELHDQKFIDYLFEHHKTYIDAKLAPGFFGIVGSSFALAYLLSESQRKLNWKSYGYIAIFFGVAILGITLESKNILIIWFYQVICLLCFFAYKLKSKLNKIYTALFFICICSLVMIGFYQYKHVQSWKGMPQDIEIAIQVDKYTHWQNRDLYGYPSRNDGSQVTVNTYERFAWGTVGLGLIEKYPLGYGIHNGAFKYLLEKEGIKSPTLAFTHSGWIDFTLGEGVPGTLFVWLAMLFTLIIAKKNNTVWGSVTYWVLPTIFFYWMIGELSNKHYVEFLFFIIAFFIGINILSNKNPLQTTNSYDPL